MESERAPVVSIELLLDASLESQIRAEWHVLADAGLSSLAAHTSPSNRPHITLLVRPSLPPLTHEQLSAVATLPIPIAIGAPILFGSGDRRVLARLVVPSTALLALHNSLHDIARESDDTSDAPFTLAGQWTPHITLARRLRLDTLPQALRLLDEQNSAGPAISRYMQGEGIALRRWDAASATVTDLLG